MSEDLQTALALIVVVLFWTNLIRYAIRNHRRPCKWRINYWR